MKLSEQKTETLLVVDDNQANLDLLLQLLSDYDVVPAPSGREALNILNEEDVDLVLLDIIMPDMDGYQVCRAMQASSRTRDIPVIFTTALDDGAKDYVTKPIKPRELRARIDTHLTLADQLQRLSRQNQSLLETERALQESRARYHLAMEAAQYGLWDWNISTGEVYYSPGWLRIIGLNKIKAAYETWEQRMHPDDLPHILKSLWMHLDGETDKWQAEHRLLRADGTWVWVLGRGRVVYRDQDGQPKRMVGTMVNIHERKRTEAIIQLRQKLAELVHGSDEEQLLRLALDTLENLTDSKIGFFHLIEQDNEQLSLQVWSSNTEKQNCPGEAGEGHHTLNAAGIWADCVREGKALTHNDYAALHRGNALPGKHIPLQRQITIPIFRRERIVAVLGVANKHIDYDERDQEIAQSIADLAYDFLERKLAEKRIEYLAFNDALTGLPNRQLLSDRLNHALSKLRRTEQILAVCYLDLDGFKPVNDTYGHATGDTLLVQLSRRLEACLREGDTLARIGGDEFVILLDNLPSMGFGQRIIQRILDAISEAFHLQGHAIRISGSIGVTFSPMDPGDADRLLRHADKAMYRAKENGRSRYFIHDSADSPPALLRPAENKAIEQALMRRQMRLFYQPRINLGNGQVQSFEALVRWRHPSEGLLPAARILSRISDHELFFSFSSWCLKAALDQLNHWRSAGKPMAISVNMNPRVLQLKRFPGFLKGLLSDYPPEVAGKLELEITETDSIEDPRQLADTMARCRQLGVRFLLDSVGSRNVSLSLCHALPIDSLKIAPEYIRHMLDREKDLDVVEGILRLAYGLQLPVIAVGVESVEVGMMLLQLGCTQAQGHGIGKPMPAESVSAWLAEWRKAEAWQRLHSDVGRLHEQFDLNVSLFSHRHWLDQVSQFINTGKDDHLPSLDQHHCQFDRWYRGIGLVRYGQHPHYPRIPGLHNAVHEKARDLVRLARDGDWTEARAGLVELMESGAELIEVLQELGKESSAHY